MLRELKKEEVLYNLEMNPLDIDGISDNIPRYKNVYSKIEECLDIDRQGYNLYLIDNFSKEKLENLMRFIKKRLSKKKSPNDICYVVNEDEKSPYPITLENSKGKVLRDTLENIQSEYLECIYEFYSDSSHEEKEIIIDELEKKRNELIENLMEESKKCGFEIKASSTGFAFIPIKEGEVLTEENYDGLEIEEKGEILDEVTYLKKEANKILDDLKDIEIEALEKIKKIMKEYIKDKMKFSKDKFRMKFENNMEVLDFLNSVCRKIEESVIENYSISYEDDEEAIVKAIYKYKVNVLVDNSYNKNPLVLFEDDPSISNLIGSIEYENRNGVYSTDVNLIKPGSILRANEGVLIIRLNSLFFNSLSYYYLKKTLLNEKNDFDYNRGYLELLSLNGLKPEPVNINMKVILIGNYESYNVLYNHDEDFKKIFKLRAEYNPIIDINPSFGKDLLENIRELCEKKKLKPVDQDAIIEISKYLSRKAENRNKIYFDDYELDKLLTQASSIAVKEERDSIICDDIIKVAYTQEIIEEEVLKEYKEKKIFITTEGKKVGQVNGLSIIDVGYFSFGRPIRITCCCYKGNGDIIDIQKESNLSGDIHDKAINILKGYINTIIGKYETLPVDFHISFEQVYGKVDGDSASVAEVTSMISSLSKIPVKQNIAITGSINQFGEVQPIGGVNDKIEGFFKVCKENGGVKGNAVIIPDCNKDNLVLKKEIEDAIAKREFSIYTMEKVEDAVEILLGERFDKIIDIINKELRRYTKRYRNKK